MNREKELKSRVLSTNSEIHLSSASYSRSRDCAQANRMHLFLWPEHKIKEALRKILDSTKLLDSLQNTYTTHENIANLEWHKIMKFMSEHSHKFNKVFDFWRTEIETRVYYYFRRGVNREQSKEITLRIPLRKSTLNRAQKTGDWTEKTSKLNTPIWRRILLPGVIIIHERAVGDWQRKWPKVVAWKKLLGNGVRKRLPGVLSQFVPN